MEHGYWEGATREERIARILVEFSGQVMLDELLTAKTPQASKLVQSDPYAFCIAACLNRQTPAEVIWSIPYDMKAALGHLNPWRINSISLKELEVLFRSLPNKPRFVNDAPRTIKELTEIIVSEFDGDARRIWDGRTASDARQTFLGIYGVGPGIANMVMLLIERTNLKHFSKADHVLMDVKPDMQVVKVLYRLGIIHQESAAEALSAARRMNPEFPGMVDSALWRIGRKWCRAQAPLCRECVLSDKCVKAGI